MPDDAIDEKSKGTLPKQAQLIKMTWRLHVHVYQALKSLILILSVETNWQGKTFIPSFKRVDKNTNTLL